MFFFFFDFQYLAVFVLSAAKGKNFTETLLMCFNMSSKLVSNKNDSQLSSTFTSFQMSFSLLFAQSFT